MSDHSDHDPAEELPDAPPTKPEIQDSSDDESSGSFAAKRDELKSSPPPMDSKKDIKAMFDSDEDFGSDVDLDSDMAAITVNAPDVKPEIKPTTSPSNSDPEEMLAFYKRLFPWRTLFQWLNHSPVPTHDFGHREFAFTLQNDVYLRYQSFPTFETLRKDVIRLNPSRFEIGPVYSANPRDRKTLRKSAFKPISKELVFDIDLTDYDDVRTCCDKANICNKCWQFITVAIKIMDVALREDLGFKHIMWIYSGRRGAHAWVCDKRARTLDDQKRRAVAAYLEVVRGNDKSGKRVNLRRPLHPHLSRSLDVLIENFGQEILRDQDPWREEEKAERLLELLQDKTLAAELRKQWSSEPGRSSKKKWDDINSAASKTSSSTLNALKLKSAKEDIIFEYLYPRLDAEVSKHLNHLLKSPFVVHPGTGRVCVPIDHENPENFDPLTVPTVRQLLKEIDEWESTHKEDAPMTEEDKISDVDKTSLKPYADYFRRFVQGLMKEEMNEVKVKRERTGDAMEF
ncbi:eukaryotic and archaeal DNA primase small subunit [Pyronema omphalodes]|nr:eukaryotic and archaeal DNA primase small subunit [Pyronema omphalodes]